MKAYAAAALLLVLALGCTQIDDRAGVQGRACLGECSAGKILTDLPIMLRLADDPSASARPSANTNEDGRFLFDNLSTQVRYQLLALDDAYTCTTPTVVYDAKTGHFNGDELPTNALLGSTPEVIIVCELNLDWFVSQEKANLCGQSLSGGDLESATLNNADFTGAVLVGANLKGASLRGATLTGADLSRGVLDDAILVGADLSGRSIGCERSDTGEPTRLTNASLNSADLSEAQLADAHLSNAMLIEADLTDADLSRALLSGASFELATLIRANLVGADLSASVFTGANLARARTFDLQGCPSQLPAGWLCVDQPTLNRFALVGPGADLSGAELSFTVLSNSDLTDVDLSNANLNGTEAHGLAGCPTALPPSWSCVSQPSITRFALIGPGAALTGADLSGANLTDIDLSNVDLHRVRAHDLPSCPTALPPLWHCVEYNGRFLLAGPGVDLSSVFLPDVSLPNVDLTGADLSRADLSRANLMETNLSSALLIETHLIEASLNMAIATEADLTGAMLQSAQMSGIQLERAALSEADLFHALLESANLTDATLTGANLAEVEMIEANVSGADMSDVDLSQANLQHVTGARVNFSGADLSYSVVIESDFSDADFTRAEITGAQLENIHLKNAHTHDLLGRCPDRVPEHFRCVLLSEGFDPEGASAVALIGPGIDLTNARLSSSNLAFADMSGTKMVGADLQFAQMKQVRATNIVTCPAILPDGWHCFETTREDSDDFYLIGPQVKLAGYNLQGADLSGIDLYEATFAGASECPETEHLQEPNSPWCPGPLAHDLLACPVALPDHWRCVVQPEVERFALIGPGANLVGADLTGADLVNSDISESLLRGTLLTDAQLTGLRAHRLPTCPETLPSDWVCMGQDVNDIYILVGPGADLTGAVLSGADFADAPLAGVRAYDLRTCPENWPEGWACVAQPTPERFALLGPESDLNGADLTRADLTGVDLSSANLSGARAYDLLGCPSSLPTGWFCIEMPSSGRFAIMGPESDLSGADLSGIDLSEVDLSGSNLAGVRATEIIGCPAMLPPRWLCVAQSDDGLYLLVGPGADLQNVDLSRVQLADADLAEVRALEITACPLSLPEGWRCIAQPSAGGFALVGPAANLSDADLRGADLRGADLSDANITNARLSGARTFDLAGCPAGRESLDVLCGNRICENEEESFTCPQDCDRSVLALPSGWRCVPQFGVTLDRHPDDLPELLSERPFEQREDVLRQFCETSARPHEGRYALVGPNADLSGADLGCVWLSDRVDASDVDFSGADLTLARIRDIDLSNADFSGATLNGTSMDQADLTGAVFEGANLTFARFNDLSGCSEPTSQGHHCIDAKMVGPGLDLSLLDLSRINLSEIDLTGARTLKVWSCRDLTPPTGWSCIEDENSITGTPGALVGPGADLRFADLKTLDFTGVDLTGTRLEHTQAHSLLGCPEGLPVTPALQRGDCIDVQEPVTWSCAEQPGGLFALVGPLADLTDANLSNTDLAGVDLTGADLTRARLSGSDLSNTTLACVTWSSSICPDGTNSDCEENCEGHLMPSDEAPSCNAEGLACCADNDCCGGLFCAEDGTCSAPLQCITQFGAQCQPSADRCCPGLYCSPEAGDLCVCGQRDQGCSEDTPCCPGFLCEDSVCVQDDCQLFEQTCGAEQPCCDGLVCVSGGTCRDVCYDEGTRCDGFIPCCFGLTCQGGTCAPL